MDNQSADQDAKVKLLDRFKAAWLAFRDPVTYWEGASIRRIAQEITDRDGMALLRPNPQTDYVVQVLPAREAHAIQRYLYG